MPPNQDAPRRRGRALVAPALVFVAAGAFFAVIQAQSPNLVGYDGYYHIKYAYILRTEGWHSKLPWLHYTIYSRFYRDHHLLFHLLLTPFTLGSTPDSLRVGAKAAATLFAAAMACSFFGFLRAARVPWAPLWMLALAGSGSAFLYRMCMPRPMAGAVALLFVAAAFFVRRRYRALGALTAIAVWYYDGYGMILLLALTFFLGGWLVEGRPAWWGLLWCLVGAAVGIVINPYFPKNVGSYAFNFYRSFSGMETRMGGGMEWRQMKTWALVAGAPGATVGLLTLALVGRWTRRLRPETIAFILVTAVAFLMTCKAKRYMEYYPPLAVAAAALTVRDAGRRRDDDEREPRPAAGRSGPGVPGRLLLLVPLVMTAAAAYVVPRLARDVRRTQDYRTFRGAAAFMAKHSEPEEIVFNADYDDFPQLFFYNHKNHYIVGLDPIYLYRYDADLFKVWREIGRGERLDVYDLLKNRFKARWVVMEREKYKRFVATTLKDRDRLPVVYADEFAFVFEVQ